MTGEEILKFFDKEISPATFALYLRRYNNAVVHNMLEGMKEGKETLRVAEIADGLFWANEFAELIDPYLEAE